MLYPQNGDSFATICIVYVELALSWLAAIVMAAAVVKLLITG